MPGVLREVLKVAAQEEIRVAMQKETALEIQPAEQCPTSSQPIRPRMQRREPHPRWIRSRGLSDPGQNISSTAPGWEESGETGVFMHSGKIPERILKRAVRKKITYRSGFLAGPPGPGRDSSVYCPAGGVPMAFCTNPVTGAADTLGYRAFFQIGRAHV